jgi:hypothetical protein
MGVKSLAFGFPLYWTSSRENKFDIIITFVTVADVVIVMSIVDEDMLINSYFMTTIKAFRILRLFKLARFWAHFQILLDTLILTAIRTSAFGCLVVFVMFSYTLVGQEFFQGVARFNPADNSLDLDHGHAPLFNFDNFTNSFFTVFLLLINDGQSVIYYNYERAVGHLKATTFWITFVFLVQKILLNVFLAILLENFN